MKTTLLVLLLGMMGQFAQAAVVTSDRMTCDRAIHVYEKYKRIYVIANGKDVVPIYGMRPISAYPEFKCPGRRATKWGYPVKTLDNENCIIAFYCQG